MQTLTVAKILDAVVFEAGIDGQVSATGRYTTERLTDLFNRTWDSLRSLVSESGHKYFLDETSSAAVPAPVTGEEYIVVAYPTVASTQAPAEVYGVDVLVGGCWTDLDPIEFSANRRTVVRNRDGSYGEWAVKKLPTENTTSVTAGEIALFPPTLGGSYKVWYLKPWIPIAFANQTYVVIGYPDWFTWAISSMVMTCVGSRDNNKKGTYQTSEAKMLRAESRIREAARRVQRGGPNIARRKDGLDTLV